MLPERFDGVIKLSVALLKEFYSLKAQYVSLPTDDLWGGIWGANFWPNVATFLWLVAHWKILTWDQLIYRGFFRSGLCVMCGKDSESSTF